MSIDLGNLLGVLTGCIIQPVVRRRRAALTDEQRRRYDVEYARRWREKNPKQVRAQKAAWRAKNREHYNTYMREYMRAKRAAS